MTVKYQKGQFRPANLVKLYGSVFSVSLVPALICGALAATLKAVMTSTETLAQYNDFLGKILENNIGFTAYSVLLSFLITFRTAKAYDRFWNGANYIKKMQAEYFVTASNLVAFCRHSNAAIKDQFQHTLIRLLSMLHAASLHQLEVGGDGVDISRASASKYALIDIYGVDEVSLHALEQEECRVEMIVQWIQSLTVDGIKTGVCTIPPPILSRIFQNLSNALTAFYSAYRVTEVPFPFPYVQATEVLLLVHFFVTPIVMQSFAVGAAWAAISSFLATLLLWSLNSIAAELENPFSQTQNVLDMMTLQTEFNKRLLLLIKPKTNKVPFILEGCIMDTDLLQTQEASDSFADWVAYKRASYAEQAPVSVDENATGFGKEVLENDVATQRMPEMQTVLGKRSDEKPPADGLPPPRLSQPADVLHPPHSSHAQMKGSSLPLPVDAQRECAVKKNFTSERGNAAADRNELDTPRISSEEEHGGIRRGGRNMVDVSTHDAIGPIQSEYVSGNEIRSVASSVIDYPPPSRDTLFTGGSSVERPAFHRHVGSPIDYPNGGQELNV